MPTNTDLGVSHSPNYEDIFVHFNIIATIYLNCIVIMKRCILSNFRLYIFSIYIKCNIYQNRDNLFDHFLI